VRKQTKKNKKTQRNQWGQMSKQTRNKQKTPGSGSLNFSLSLSSGVTLPASNPGVGI
jgi:hypothetical protein